MAALALVVLGASALHAQKPQKYRVVGTVVDGQTGRPVVAASVALQGTNKAAYTDTAGRFVIDRVPEGPHVLEVEQLGYDDRDYPIQVAAAAPGVRVELSPNPVMLKAITVLTDRFRSRRNSVPMSVLAYDRKQLLTSGAYDMRNFLATRTGAMSVPCGNRAYYYGWGFGGGGMGGGDLGCVWVRGQVVQPAVYIDDRPAFGDELAGYNPADLFLLEVYGRGVVIRAYTNWWVESMAKRKLGPLPLF